MISQFFLQLTDHVNDTNRHIVQHFFANVNVIDCLIESLKKITSISHTNFVGGIEHMIDAYQKLHQDPIVDFVKSSDYINIFSQLSSHQNEFTHYEKLVSSNCDQYYDEVTSAIAQQILSR